MLRESFKAVDAKRKPFAVRCAGDCLESDGICDGDIIIVNPAEGPQNGSTALVSMSGFLSLKHIFLLNNGDVVLRSDDGKTHFTGEQQEHEEFMIVGAMVCSIHKGRIWTL